MKTLIWLATLLPLTGTDTLLEQPLRRRLVRVITDRPGIHASELAREVEEAWGTVQYHLSLLRKADIVSSVEAGRERRFFPAGIDESKARLLSLLHQGRRPDITRFIHEHPGARQVDICQALDVSRKTFRASVRPLVEEGLVHEQRGLHANRYFAGEGLEPALAEMAP